MKRLLTTVAAAAFVLAAAPLHAASHAGAMPAKPASAADKAASAAKDKKKTAADKPKAAEKK
jgi:hypothetical protein